MGESPASRPAPLPFPPCFLGIRVSGDIAGLTIFQTRRSKTVCYPASAPKEPPTARQLEQRARWRTAVATWLAADQATRNAYEQISLAASLCATGHNLWVHLAYSQREAELASLIRSTGINAPMPPAV